MDAFQHFEGVTNQQQPSRYYLLEYCNNFEKHSMSMQAQLQALDGIYQPSSLRGCGPYEPSIASSASSSQASVFSDSCGSSIQSSIASSISDDFRQNQEDARDRACAQAQIRQQFSCENTNPSIEHAKLAGLFKDGYTAAPSYADVTSIPTEQRQHPRRSSVARSQKPPTLQRQCDRKQNFVESLVGKPINNIYVY